VTNKSGNGKRLAGSQLGYYGKGVLEEAEVAKALEEVVNIASELTPILHFNVEDVDWDK